MKKKLEFHHCILIIIGILVLDQFLKVYIKTELSSDHLQ